MESRGLATLLSSFLLDLVVHPAQSSISGHCSHISYIHTFCAHRVLIPFYVHSFPCPLSRHSVHHFWGSAPLASIRGSCPLSQTLQTPRLFKNYRRIAQFGGTTTRAIIYQSKRPGLCPQRYIIPPILSRAHRSILPLTGTAPSSAQR